MRKINLSKHKFFQADENASVFRSALTIASWLISTEMRSALSVVANRHGTQILGKDNTQKHSDSQLVLVATAEDKSIDKL